jgi:D-threo-aldose 1-dehydrogenase
VGRFLRTQPRQGFVVSTKVGRVLTRPADPATLDTSPWVGGLPFEIRFDYSAEGITRSYEDSLQRLGLTRVDLLLIHDLDFRHHKREELVETYLDQLSKAGGWSVLQAMRQRGEIAGIGAGINELGMIPRFLDRFEIDFFLVAMPYTLLDQGSLAEELTLCSARGVGIVIGAPYASGILAAGPGEAPMYRYRPAKPDVIEKVRRMRAVCDRFDVPLKAAALQFPLGHPAVASVIAGAVSAANVRENLAMMRWDIPSALWQALKSERFIDAAAPTP